MQPRALVRRTLRRRKQPAGKRGVQCEPNPTDPETLDDFKLFAVLGTWMEEDVVEATVRNAFAQGVERVFLVDNDSTDATVERATAAGATLAEKFHTETYEERVRILLMNSVVARVSLSTRAKHIWWLWMDADEFPEGPDGTTIKQYLSGLDRRFRVVGGTYFNHFPDHKPEYIPGFHPVDMQPLCELFSPPTPSYCAQPHWKHPLQRFDQSGPFLMSVIGFHTATLIMNAPVTEPVGGINAHHAQYRDEQLTRARMELLCGGTDRNAYNNSLGNLSIKRRYKTLDAVYAREWAEVDTLGGGLGIGVDPRPWSYPGPPARWYDPSELEAAIAAWGREQAAAR